MTSWERGRPARRFLAQSRGYHKRAGRPRSQVTCFLHSTVRVSAFTLIEPATGETLASIPQATADDTDRAIRAAAAAFPKWRAVNTRDRGRMLLRLSQLIRENRDQLARMESRNVGKPIRDSRDEVGLAANCFEYYAGTTNKVGGQTIPGAAPGVLMTFREPIGVCGIIVPWNFPIAITSWKVAPALAMGNSVVLKPAEQTPITAMRLAEIALAAGVPEGVFTVITEQANPAIRNPKTARIEPPIEKFRL